MNTGENRVFLLEHEAAGLKRRLAGYSSRQHELADRKGEAVSEGGDGWHDNSAFDAVIADSKMIAAAGGRIAKILERAEVIEYPDPEGEEIAVGSRVTLDMFGDLVVVDLVGAIEAYPDDIDGVDHMRTSPESPLGQAIFGKTLNDRATYMVGNDRSMTVNVQGIDQVAIHETYGSE